MAPPAPAMNRPDATRHAEAATRTREATRSPPVVMTSEHFYGCDDCRTIRSTRLLVDGTAAAPGYATARPQPRAIVLCCAISDTKIGNADETTGRRPDG